MQQWACMLEFVPSIHRYSVVRQPVWWRLQCLPLDLHFVRSSSSLVCRLSKRSLSLLNLLAMGLHTLCLEHLWNLLRWIFLVFVPVWCSSPRLNLHLPNPLILWFSEYSVLVRGVCLLVAQRFQTGFGKFSCPKRSWRIFWGWWNLSQIST